MRGLGAQECSVGGGAGQGVPWQGGARHADAALPPPPWYDARAPAGADRGRPRPVRSGRRGLDLPLPLPRWRHGVAGGRRWERSV
eukprot:6832069-Pyramimonas_sp.AAC.1